MDNLLNKTTDELAQMLGDWEGKILKAEDNRDIIEQEINHLRRIIDETKIKIRDLESGLIKAKCVVRERRKEHKDIDRAFWKTRRG